MYDKVDRRSNEMENNCLIQAEIELVGRKNRDLSTQQQQQQQTRDYN